MFKFSVLSVSFFQVIYATFESFQHLRFNKEASSVYDGGKSLFKHELLIPLLLVLSLVFAIPLLGGIHVARLQPIVSKPSANEDSTRIESPLVGENARTNGSVSTRSMTPSAPMGISGEARLVTVVNLTSLPRKELSQSRETNFTSQSLVANSSYLLPPKVGQTNMSNIDPPSIITSFAGLNMFCAFCDHIPPDVQVAAGPSYLMELANYAGLVYTKSGRTVGGGVFALSTFFGTGSDKITDPKLIFDLLSGRWFASISDETGNNIMLAVSNTNDPNGVWHVYSVMSSCEQPTCYLDRPTIGVSNTELVVSTNNFQGCNASFGNCNPGFVGAEYWVLNKSDMTEGSSSVSLTAFGPDSTLAPAYPVKSLSSTQVEYMVSAGVTTTGEATSTIKLFALTGIPPAPIGGTTPTILTMSPSVSMTVPGTQPGSNPMIDTGDTRVLDAAWFSGKLWFALNDGCTPLGDIPVRSCFRLTEIDTGSTNVIQSFDYGQSGLYLFYPAVTMDSMGNLALVYGYSGPSNYPSFSVTEQAVNDPLNTLEPSQTIATASVADNQCCPERYGDYFGASVDPADPSMVWVAGEYVYPPGITTCTLPGGNPSNCWSTFIAEMRTSDFTLTANPSSLTVGAYPITSPITLTSLRGFSSTIDLAPQVSVSISAVNVDDSYGRDFGLVFDTPLNQLFASAQAYSVIGTTSPGQTSFSYSNSYSKPLGSHFLEFGVDSYPGHWHVQIMVNGVLMADIDVDDNHFVHLAFGVGGVTVSGGPSGATPPSASISPASVTPTPGGSVSSALTISTSPTTTPGIYIVTVYAGSAALLYSAALVVQVYSDFKVSLNPNSLNVNQGVPGTSTVTVTSFAQFSGTVTLSAGNVPSGFSVAFNQGSLSVPSGGSASGAMTVSVSGSPSAGTYVFNLLANASSQSHTILVSVVHTGDFNISANPGSLSILQGKTGTSTITVGSLDGFTGTVSLTSTVLPYNNITTSLSSSNVGLNYPGSAQVTLTVSPYCTARVGSYTATVKGTFGSIIHSVNIPVTVTDNSLWCGSGSVAAGTLITLANGTQVPVQTLRVGMQLLSYDMTTHQYVTTTITRLTSVLVSNLMIIQTGIGAPLRVDQNPLQKVYAKLQNGTITLISVTDLKVGYYLFQAISQTWVPITAISYINQGQYIMFDIYNTAPGNYIANGYLDPTKQGPGH